MKVRHDTIALDIFNLVTRLSSFNLDDFHAPQDFHEAVWYELGQHGQWSRWLAWERQEQLHS